MSAAGILSSITAVFGTAKLAMQRFWGGQSSEQARCQEAAEIALKNKRDAYKRAWAATTKEHYALAMDDVNYWDHRLRELHAEASAKWG
jgi:hypothetical protein